MKFDNNSKDYLSRNFVPIYTALRIFDRMRRQLGLEAALEYLDAYLRMIDRSHPLIKRTVTQVLEVMDVERMYTQAVLDKD
ncbi:MAG: hypothetical protein ACLFPX_08570 [Candidatus Omnitrophota bacterium]